MSIAGMARAHGKPKKMAADAEVKTKWRTDGMMAAIALEHAGSRAQINRSSSKSERGAGATDVHAMLNKARWSSRAVYEDEGVSAKGCETLRFIPLPYYLGLACATH